MTDLASIQVVAYGCVQGVFFRDFTFRKAINLGLTGYVRNLSTLEAVEVQAEGERRQLEMLIGCLKIGPPTARVDRVVVNWSKYTGGYPSFRIKY